MRAEGYESGLRLTDLEHAPIGMLVLVDSERVVYANRAAAGLLGREPQALLDLSLPLAAGDEATVIEVAQPDGGALAVSITCQTITWHDQPATLVYLANVTAELEAASAARETAQRLRLAAGQSRDLVYEWDLASGRITWHGDTRSAGEAPPVELPATLGRWLALLGPEDRDTLALAATAARSSGQPIHIEYRIRAVDGKTRIWRHRGAVVNDDWGEPARLVGVCSDVTDSREAQRALAVSEQRSRTIIEQAPYLIVLLREGRFIYGNPATLAILGLPDQAAFVGRSAVEVVAPEDHAVVAGRLAQAMRGEPTEPAEYRFLRADGSRFLARVSSVPIELVDGPATLVLAQDVTTQRQNERVLRLLNQVTQVFLTVPDDEVYAEVLELLLAEFASPWGYFGYINRDGDLVSPSLTRGIWDQCQVPGRSILFPRSHWSGLWGQSLLERRTLVQAGGLTPPAGHVPLESAVAVPLLAGGELVGQFCLANQPGGYADADVALLEQVAEQVAPILRARLQAQWSAEDRATEQAAREQLEAQLRQAQKMEAVGQLAGGIAHDFNNLLTSIRGYTDFIYTGLPDDDPLRQDAAEVISAADRAASLTQQLLAFSRQQANQPRVFDLNALVAGMQRLLERTLGEDVRLTVDLCPDGCGVRADPGQMEQVLMNLAVNARAAMPGGGELRVRTQLGRADSTTCSDEITDPVNYVWLEVSDTGSGMDEATASRIFEPFFTTKPIGQGTGLGLSTVYGIVTHAGGRVQCQTKLGEGTRFLIELPAFDLELASDQVAEAAAPIGRGETILLVEDEEPVRKMTCRTLEAAGYEVITAASAEEALALAETMLPQVDLLLTDVVMPGANGAELAATLRQRRPDLPVIFCSGYTNSALAPAGIDPSASGFLAKPYATTLLLTLLRQTLDG